MTTLQQTILTAALDASSRGLISGTTNWAAFVAKAIKAALAQQGQEPVAWAIFTDEGNARMWSTLQPHVQRLADAEGLTITPLYAEPTTQAQPVAAKEPVKLYAGPPDAPPTEKRFFDGNGTEYTLMNGCLANCNFVGFEKLVAAGLQVASNDEPKNADGIIRARMEIVDIEPVAQQHKLSDGDLIDAVANSIKAANNTT